MKITNVSPLVGKAARKWFVNKDIVHNSEAERIIEHIIKQYDVLYDREISFDGLKFSTGGHARFDFIITRLVKFLPTKVLRHCEIVIEYDGKESHKTEEQKARDKIKTDFCKTNGIKLIRWNSQDYYHLEERIAELFAKYEILKMSDMYAQLRDKYCTSYM